jgi:hypothetical protein
LQRWSNLEYRVRCEDSNSRDGKTIMWTQVRNRYNKTAHLNVGITPQGERGEPTDRLSIGSGREQSTFFTVRVQACEAWSFWVGRVRFGEDSGPYAD